MMISSSIINTISIRLVPPLSLSSSSSSGKTFFKCRSSNNNSNNNNNSDDNNFKDALSGMMGEQVEELLSREENKVLMDRLEKASQRVENAKTELAFIQKQELALKQFKDYTQQLEGKASQIAQSQREISEAKAMLEEAERNLLLNGRRRGEAQEQEIDRDEERLESLKAASISALVGTFSWLPLCFAQSTTTTQLLLSLAINFISCALFGVTFRYTVRTNLDDFQLKTGVAAAFAVVKGLAILSAGPLLELNFQSLLSYASDGTIYVSENLVIFLSAAISLDYCLKTRLLSPFPIDRTG
ncbi:homer protein [Trifolium repens]|nr:homer protein [Trifolium repens]